MSSWNDEIKAHAAKVAAIRANPGHPDGIVARFTQRRFAYALLPLRPSPKQIREANHLLLRPGYCYLRLFAVKYRRQIAQCLGKLPTYQRVEQQLRSHAAFPRHDSLVTAYISGPFVAHIAKSRKENPFHLGTLHRLNEGMPIRLGAAREPSPSTTPAITAGDQEMINVALIPMSTSYQQLRSTKKVPANQMTTAQQQVIMEVWNSIQLARQSTQMNEEDLQALEDRVETLTDELNVAYRTITEDTAGGMNYLHQNLHGLATQASQFSGLVHQQLARTAEGEEKIVTLQVANKCNNDNLEILAQIVQAEAARRNKLDTKLDTWARKKNQEVSASRGDTTLTKEEITQHRNELQWERTNRRKEKEAQTKAIADLETKVNTALPNSSTLEKARQEVATNLRVARAESMSTMAEITERLAQVPTRKRRPMAAALLSQEEEFLKAQRERLEFLKGNREAGKVPPPPPPRQPPIAAGGDPDDDPGDDDDDPPPSERSHRGRPDRHRSWDPSRSQSRDPRQLDKDEFAETIALAAHILSNMKEGKEEDSGKRLPVKEPDTFDGTFTKFRRWWESMDEYFTIHKRRVSTNETKIFSVGTFLRDQSADWYIEWKRTLRAAKLNDNWEAFSKAIENRFTDQQETGKDHEKLLALEYGGDIQTFLARFNELNSRVHLSGQALKRALMVAMSNDMYKSIWRKYGKIPDNDADLLKAVREAGPEEEELARATVAKKSMARPQKEKEKEAVLKGKMEQKAVKATEKDQAPVKGTGGTGPAVKDKYPEQEILWGSFAEAVKGVPDDEFKKHREEDADCRRCGRNGHKTRACFAQTTAKGKKLAPPPKLPSGKASAIRMKRLAKAEPEPEKEVEKTATVPRPIKKARAAAPRERSGR